jgi:hypothetical protein
MNGSSLKVFDVILAKMNAENVAVMQFLKTKGEAVGDLATARGFHERFLALLPEGIPNVLEDLQRGQAEPKSKMRRISQRRVLPKKRL